MHAIRSIVQTLYGLYASILFVVMVTITALLCIVVPGLQRRRVVARSMSRAWLLFIGMPVKLIAEENLPQGQCVVVSNHASYLDGIVFTAALPARFGFVIKREMANVPLFGLFLTRLGAMFVERYEAKKSAADARKVLREALNGVSLVFFPEGTFTPEPGLLRFHTGAFTTAVRAGCPLVPAVVRGTRVALSPQGALPRLSRIEIEILRPLPLPPEEGPRDPALELRDRARAAILACLGEPDLTCSGDIAPPPDTEHQRSAQESST